MALISKIKGTNGTEYNVRDDVSVWGGRNLIKNSNFNNDIAYWTENKNSSNTVIEIIKENNKNWLHIVSNNSIQSQQYYDGVNQVINFNNNNDLVTVSFLAKGSINNVPLYIGFAMYNTDDNVTIVDKTINLTTTVSKYWFIQSLSNYSSTDLFIGSNSTPIEVWITNIKLEQGTKPTDWSPAPEDIAYVNGECLELLS